MVAEEGVDPGITSSAAARELGSVSAVQDAVALIRQTLLAGHFRPGQRLKVAKISRELGISAMPVREALRQLEGEGVIQILPNRGAIVRTLDERFLTDLYEVRTALQEIALRRAIDRITLEKLLELEAICCRFESAAADDDPLTALAANRDLSMALFEIGGNSHATRIFQRDWELVQALRLRFGYREGRLKLIAKEQRMLLNALRQGDLEAALATIRLHNRAGLEDIFLSLREQHA